MVLYIQYYKIDWSLLQIYNIYSIFSHFSYSSKPSFQSYNGIIGVIYRLSAFLDYFDIVMLF